MWHIIGIITVFLGCSNTLYAALGSKVKQVIWRTPSTYKTKLIRPPKPREQIRNIFQREQSAPSTIQQQPIWRTRFTNLLHWRPSFTFAPMLRFFFGPPQAEITTAMWRTFETIAVAGWHYDQYKITDIERYKPYINSPRPGDGKTILTVACDAYFSTDLLTFPPKGIYENIAARHEQNIYHDILRYIELFMALGANFGNEPQITVLKLLQNKYRMLDLMAQTGDEKHATAVNDLFTKLDEKLKTVAQSQKIDYRAIDTLAKKIVSPNQSIQKSPLPEE